MNISLTPEQAAIVREKVESGMYNNNSEVVEEAFRLLDQQDKLKRLRATISSAQEQIARGEGIPVTSEYLASISREVDERARRGDRPSADVLP